MDTLYLLLQSITIFFLRVIFIQVLKRQGIFNDSHQPIFNRLITELALPAVIFSSLATMTFRPDRMVTTAILIWPSHSPASSRSWSAGHSGFRRRRPALWSWHLHSGAL